MKHPKCRHRQTGGEKDYPTYFEVRLCVAFIVLAYKKRFELSQKTMSESVKTTLYVPKLGKVIKEVDFIKWRGQFVSYANVKSFGGTLHKENIDLL